MVGNAVGSCTGVGVGNRVGSGVVNWVDVVVPGKCVWDQMLRYEAGLKIIQ